MEDHNITLHNVLTHIITFGDPFKESDEDIIVCITGNPGLPDFYKEFGQKLYDFTGLDLVIVGHAGHEEFESLKSNNIINGREALFNLNGQIQHKLDLLKNNIDPKRKIHLIGHSIGAWMALEILDCSPVIGEKVLSINLLFPTIQHIAKSKNGLRMNSVVRHRHFLWMILYILFDFIPNLLKHIIIKWYITYKGYDTCTLEAAKKYLRPSVIENVLFLAYDEMDNVLDLNEKTIEKYKDKINVIYGEKDGWAPVEFIKPLEKFEPDISLQLVPYNHAFVLKNSKDVAFMVKKHLQLKMSRFVK